MIIGYGIERDVICIQRQNFPLISHPRILYLETDFGAISSSKIRKNIKENEPNIPLSKSVLDYISQNRLYQ